MDEACDILVIGAGAAGIFAAITAAERAPHARVLVLEKAVQPLAKVRISGGGRCNVTHDCPDPARFAESYPRGRRELVGPLHRWGMPETVDWFHERGVALKTEPDGRMFPVTDRSATIIDALLGAARSAGVRLRLGCVVQGIERSGATGFVATTAAGPVHARCVLLATGGARDRMGPDVAAALGHTIEPPVPSLFSLRVRDARLADLAGVSMPLVEVGAAGVSAQRGAILVTHMGLSGPAILRLSAWGARTLHASAYRFELSVNWAPDHNADSAAAALEAVRRTQPRRTVANTTLCGLPRRLWATLCRDVGLPDDRTLAALRRTEQDHLARALVDSRFPVDGQATHREEFVTCGGIRLAEMNLRSCESRVCPGLYAAGELLDIDGITGGFNFQAAWTTGRLAGEALAARCQA